MTWFITANLYSAAPGDPCHDGAFKGLQAFVTRMPLNEGLRALGAHAKWISQHRQGCTYEFALVDYKQLPEGVEVDSVLELGALLIEEDLLGTGPYANYSKRLDLGSEDE